MPIIPKTLRNPHGLSSKQKLVIDDIVHDIELNKPINAVKSTSRAYNTTNRKVLANISSNNMHQDDFRSALIEKLHKSHIIGRNSRIAGKLSDGLEAVTVGKFAGDIDYRARLDYIKEVNKITGVYAPEKVDKKTLNINVDMTTEELHKRINELQKELLPD